LRRIEYIVKGCDPKTLTVRQLMEDAAVTCSPHATAEAVALMLCDRNFGSLPVVDEDRILLGLVSEFDLLKAMTVQQDLRKVKAGDIMSRDVVTVTAEMSVMDLIELLRKCHLIRVPVLEGERLVGIVARRDILFGYIKARSFS